MFKIISLIAMPFTIFDVLSQRLESGHGVLVTTIGLIAVFTGLVILWAVTASFPKILALLDKKPARKEDTVPAGETESVSDNKKDIAIAISVALCLELEDEDISVITLRNIEQDISPWVVASRPTIMRH